MTMNVLLMIYNQNGGLHCLWY